MTTTRPPGARSPTARGREAVSSSSSRLTAMRSAWNVRRAGWGPPRRPPPAPARTHDGGRHPPRPPLLSVLEQDPRELVLRRGVHEVRGALRLRVHPHVERTRLPEAEAALRPLELHRRDAKVVEESVGPALHGHLREPGADPDEPRSEPRQASGGSLEGLRVAVDPDQASDPRLEECLGVTSRPERHVDHGPPSPEEPDDLVHHDRPVAPVVVHADRLIPAGGRRADRARDTRPSSGRTAR